MMMPLVTPQGLVQAGLFPDEAGVINEAIRILWQERPQLRIEWAMYQYRHQDISLAKAAALANVSFDRMKEMLMKHGIQPRLGSETLAEAHEEVDVLNNTLARDTSH